MDSNNVIIIRETAEYGPAVIGALVTGFFLLLAAYIAYKGGLETYFRKREHEQIIRRYLDEGVDRVLAGVNEASRVFLNNYLTAWLAVDKLQQNIESDFTLGFQQFQRHYLELTPHNKITRLTGDIIFWQVIQHFFGFVDAEHDFLNTAFRSNLAKIVDGQVSQGKGLKKMKFHLDQAYQKFQTFSSLVPELQQIVSTLEKQTTLTWADLDKFKTRPEVRASVGKLKQEFAEVLSKKPKDEQKQ